MNDVITLQKTMNVLAGRCAIFNLVLMAIMTMTFAAGHFWGRQAPSQRQRNKRHRIDAHQRLGRSNPFSIRPQSGLIRPNPA
jgi:hypothetical protein